MLKKISELPSIDSVDGEDVIPIVDVSTGITKKVRTSQISGGGAGACTPEQFGAVGDGVTDDQAAFNAAAAAISDGKYSALVLGAKTYRLSTGYSVPANSSLVGQGMASVIYSTANITIVDVNGVNGVTLRGFRVKGNSTGGSQDGIHAYSEVFRASDLTVEYCGGIGILCYVGPNNTDFNAQNWSQIRVSHCTGRGVDASREYTFFRGLQIDNCGYGLVVGAGNVDADVMITRCTTGVWVAAGGNDGHGIVRGQINHNTTAISIGALLNGHTFEDCHIYEGAIIVAANTGMVQFSDCVIDATSYSFTDSRVKFSNCRIDQAYFASYTESGAPDVEWHNCRELDGTVPSFIGSRVRKAYTFPSDANQTLTAQQSRAAVIEILPGVLTASRNLVSARPPGAGESVHVANRNSQTVNYYWASGAGIAIPSNNTAIVDGDGSKAVARIIASNVASSVGGE